MSRHSVFNPLAGRPPYRPVGMCIYCFRQPTEVRLTDEHILPSGLGGNLLLPASSCDDCAAITGRMEQHLLRHQWKALRGRFGLRSRHRPKRKQAKGIGIELHDEEDINSTNRREVSVPFSTDSPFLALNYLLGPPMMLTPPGEPRTIITYMTCDGDLTAENMGANIYIEASVNAAEYLRVLAKIVYSYAVAEAGLAAFDPLLPPLILAHNEELIHRYIGSTITEASPDNDFHTIQLIELDVNMNESGERRRYLAANIHLFAQVVPIQYQIVVGRLY